MLRRSLIITHRTPTVSSTARLTASILSGPRVNLTSMASTPKKQRTLVTPTNTRSLAHTPHRNQCSDSEENSKSVDEFKFWCIVVGVGTAIVSTYNMFSDWNTNTNSEKNLEATFTNLGFTQDEKWLVKTLFVAHNVSHQQKYYLTTPEQARDWLLKQTKLLQEKSLLQILQLNSTQKETLDNIALRFPDLSAVKKDNRNAQFYIQVTNKVVGIINDKNKAYLDAQAQKPDNTMIKNPCS